MKRPNLNDDKTYFTFTSLYMNQSKNVNIFVTGEAVYLVKALIALIICLLQNTLRSVVSSLFRCKSLWLELSMLRWTCQLLQAILPVRARPLGRRQIYDQLGSLCSQSDADEYWLRAPRLLSEICSFPKLLNKRPTLIPVER